MTFKPTPQQERIIQFIGENPSRSVMVDARAGAAKTSTIEMAAQNIGPEFSVAAVAFNKRIAEELKSRLPAHFECLTLNSLGHRAWQSARAMKMNLDADKMFKLVKATMGSEKAEDNDLFTDVLNLARKAKSAGLVPAGAPFKVQGLLPDTSDSWESVGHDIWDLSDDAIYFARTVLLNSINEAFKGNIDFDDQIYMSVLFGGKFPKYHTVIVDEAQDLSPLNHLQLTKCVGTRLIAVGDPYQAIYAFRGADSNSMTNLMDHFQFERLGLTQSFRCPHKVSARQTDHVPDYESFATCSEGTVLQWPKDLPNEEDGRKAMSWSLAMIPRDGFVLCRNNAPLMKLAFALIKQRRPVKVLGRDIGTSLANLLDKVCSKQDIPVGEAYDRVQDWAKKELAKAGDNESKLDTIYDRKECLEVLLDASDAKTSQQACRFIRELFSDNAKGDDLILSSGHRAKGLEKHWVMHLDPHRVPSIQAQKAEARGNPGPMMQEKNLKYVIETRTKSILVEAALETCIDVGGDL
jgi:hypothetical protein